MMASLAIDLHTHSTYSDGSLSPKALVHLAHQHGARLMALTDHDTLDGLEEGAEAAAALGILWWHGVEISVLWGKHTVHIVGLGVNPKDPSLKAHLAQLQELRWMRAQQMAESLDKHGIRGSLAGALQHSGNSKNTISRTHFARFLINEGHASSMAQVFKKFLTEGKPGFVPTQWASLQEAVEWITQAGGYAVLAHPGRYDMKRSKLITLLDEFRRYGGCGMEVISSSHTPRQTQELTILADQFSLMGSLGSDFHAPQETWRCVGKNPALPACLTPIWCKHPDYLSL
jgi:predicted metal-dependent phosphoesterase TrpH